MAGQNSGIKIICENRKARHEYHFLELFEAGIALQGTEVKSLRAGKGNLQDAFARVENGEIFLVNMHISPYDMGNRYNHQPTRSRRLLMHKSEIRNIYAKVREKGLTVIPIKAYFVGSKVKIELALAQGKKLYDKRDDMIAKVAKRDIERAIKERSRE
ncbi:MAG: SsrA-binding protein SmpB [Clostridiales bacterium]